MKLKERNTTVAITAQHLKLLERYCLKIGIQKIDFIPLSLAFFKKYSINILLHEAPHDELRKMNQRIEHLFKFHKVQERDLIKPSFIAITTSEERIKQYLEGIKDKEETSQYKLILHSIKEHEIILNEIKNSLNSLSQKLDESQPKKKGFF